MRLLVLGAGALACAATCAHAQNFVTQRAAPVTAFQAMLGMNVHLEYTDGLYDGTAMPNGVSAVQNVIYDLNYLSGAPRGSAQAATYAFRRLRDGMPDPGNGAVYQTFENAIAALVANGDGFDLLTGGDIATQLAQAQIVANLRPGVSYLTRMPPAVTSLEGPNEVSSSFSYGGQSGDAAAIAYDRNLYAAKNASALVHTYLSDFTSEAQPGVCVIGAYADSENVHPYPNQGSMPDYYVGSAFAQAYGTLPAHCPYGSPKVITEDGYAQTDDSNVGTARAFCSDAGACGSGGDINSREVSQDAAMRQTLDMAFDAWQARAREIDFYQLLAAYPDPDGNNEDPQFGWFNYDGSPRPVAEAFHAMMLDMLDAAPAPSVEPSLTYSLASSVTGVSTALFYSAQYGDFILAAWQEPALWNASTRTENNVAAATLTLTLPREASLILQQDPTLYGSGTWGSNSNGPQTIATCQGCSTTTAQLGASPLLFLITP